MHLGRAVIVLSLYLTAASRCRAPVTSILISQQLKRCFATCCFHSTPSGPTRNDRPTFLSSHLNRIYSLCSPRPSKWIVD